MADPVRRAVDSHQLALAQTDTGAISGIVNDASAAVVPGATVTLTNNATGPVRVTSTDASGVYSIPNIPPGAHSGSVDSRARSRRTILAYGTTCSISSKNIARRVFFVYRSTPVITASVLCLLRDFTWRHSIYTRCGKEHLIVSLALSTYLVFDHGPSCGRLIHCARKPEDSIGEFKQTHLGIFLADKCAHRDRNFGWKIRSYA
jgi:hypothetical protein